MVRPASMRAEVHELCSRLAQEYVDVVPPGRILAWVILTERRLRVVNPDPESRLELVEASVRQQLVQAAPSRGKRLRRIG